jgi:hypothetical protein
MKSAKSNILVFLGALLLASSIAFHAWWPSYAADHEKREFMAMCYREVQRTWTHRELSEYELEKLCLEEYSETKPSK